MTGLSMSRVGVLFLMTRSFVIVALASAALLVFAASTSAQPMSGNPALPATNPALPTPQGLPSQVSNPANSGAATASNMDTGYQLGPGDHVHITVFGQKDLTGDYQIDGAGNLAFPLIGSVHAGGMTATELQQAIASKLSPKYIRNPSVNAEVINYRPFYILGEVKNAGAYPYVSGMTVIIGVAIAGGFTYRARKNDFYIERTENGSHVQIDANQNTPVRPGDVVTVRERFF
jgi:protein involved in polysaccharide export with SLBB domain